MDPNALYAALNTVAQCAAALAALIGFLGLWRLDRLREERSAVELTLRAVVRDNRVLVDFPTEDLIRYARSMAQQQPGSPYEALVTQWDALPGEQQRLMEVLQRFLRRTLVILVLAISGLVVADALYAWVLTRWLTGLLIIVAAYRLWRDTAAVAREAARSARALIILALVLLATPALAATPTHCTTYEEKTLNRLHTLCSDGTRAISAYNKTLSRWETTVTESPKKFCTGHLNPRTQRVEARCR
jgi:small-conductance mechanosensitive channel